MIIFELIHKDLHRPCNLVNLKEEMEIFFLINSWEEKVQRVHLKDPVNFQNASLWVCGCECLSRIFFKLIYLFLAVLGFCCLWGFPPAAVSGGHSLVAVHGPLTAAASLAAEHSWCTGFRSCGSQAREHRLKSCGTRASLLCGV